MLNYNRVHTFLGKYKSMKRQVQKSSKHTHKHKHKRKFVLEY